MSTPVFAFTRNPSTKVSVAVVESGLVQADNELVLLGRRAAAGGTAVNGVAVQIENFGNPVTALVECDAKFGAGAEITEMIIAAIEANLFGGREPKAYPKIKAIPVPNLNTSADLAATLATLIAMPMPYLAVPYPLTDAVARGAVRDHLAAISASDRGDNGQFGSFGFLATDGTLAAATAAGEAAAKENILGPWLRDTAGVKANKLHKVAAAVAAICAANGLPFLPLNDVPVGKLVAPVSAADHHTGGDTGSVALGLESGLIPLKVNFDGSIRISRTVTTRRDTATESETAYYDMQDWAKLYYFRKNCYTLARQPRYATAHATDQKALSLKSEIIATAKEFERLEMFQKVDELADQFTVTRSPVNRHAFIYGVPVNVVPGFHNQGIGIEGTTQFDSITL